MTYLYPVIDPRGTATATFRGVLDVLNKFGPSGHGEAQVQYLDGDFRVVSPGTYVRCAVTGVQIPLDELKYWGVDLQEAYAAPPAVLQRHFPAAVKAEGSLSVEEPILTVQRNFFARVLNSRSVVNLSSFGSSSK